MHCVACKSVRVEVVSECQELAHCIDCGHIFEKEDTLPTDDEQRWMQFLNIVSSSLPVRVQIALIAWFHECVHLDDVQYLYDWFAFPFPVDGNNRPTQYLSQLH